MMELLIISNKLEKLILKYIENFSINLSETGKEIFRSKKD